ncbi:MAG: hypothetical protein OEM38_10660 [Gammaproteobacteria bacterium]|nr:hypothetical protein [Gammaproteobacteria bacterium]
MNEITALKAMHGRQRSLRKACLTVFVSVVFLASIVFVVFPKELPGVLMQIFMVIVMACVFGLVFLDRVSFTINKKLYKKDILHDYLFTHSIPEDIHKDIELVQELIVSRRQAAQETKRG